MSQQTQTSQAVNAHMISKDLQKALAIEDSQWALRRLFSVSNRLGKGSDGEVTRWEHLATRASIAVKSPMPGRVSSRKAILKEISNFQTLGVHEHIVHAIGFNRSALSPQLFLEFCELGSLIHYRKKWCQQERAAHRPGYPSDITMWKLFKDMSLALDFLHNRHEVCYVHNDLKPDNILVKAPPGWKATDGIPMEPIFQITDVARLAVFPPESDTEVEEWFGTPEFAPPVCERTGPVTPAVDIWSLAATLQAFKTGQLPIQSKQAYINDQKARGQSYPNPYDEGEWLSMYIRSQLLVVYRPLNVSAQKLRRDYDLPDIEDDYQPSDYALQVNYQMLWREDPKERVTSADLVKHLVPGIDLDIVILKSKRETEACRLRASLIRGTVSAVLPSASYSEDEWKVGVVS